MENPFQKLLAQDGAENKIKPCGSPPAAPQKWTGSTAGPCLRAGGTQAPLGCVPVPSQEQQDQELVVISWGGAALGCWPPSLPRRCRKRLLSWAAGLGLGHGFGYGGKAGGARSRAHRLQGAGQLAAWWWVGEEAPRVATHPELVCERPRGSAEPVVVVQAGGVTELRPPVFASVSSCPQSLVPFPCRPLSPSPQGPELAGLTHSL